MSNLYEHEMSIYEYTHVSLLRVWFLLSRMEQYTDIGQDSSLGVDLIHHALVSAQFFYMLLKPLARIPFEL